MFSSRWLHRRTHASLLLCGLLGGLLAGLLAALLLLLQSLVHLAHDATAGEGDTTEQGRQLVVGADGKPELVNSRAYGNVLIVDRLFGAAELRLGSGERQQTVRIVRTDGRPAS